MIEGEDNLRVLSNIAAGPLENLLVRHGDTVIELVEQRASHDEHFRKVLEGVWERDMKDDIWERIKRLRQS